MSPIIGAPRAPYALEANKFPFPELAAYSGRASMGGPREIALACLLIGRLVLDARAGTRGLAAEQRRARAQGARSWLGSAAIPAAVRGALSRLADASAGDDAAAIRVAVESVMTVTANHLDPRARLEFGRLAQIVAE